MTTLFLAPCKESGVYYSGSRVAEMDKVTTEENCQLVCQSHYDCQFWYWSKSSKRCTLMKNKGGKNNNADYVTGNKYCDRK